MEQLDVLRVESSDDEDNTSLIGAQHIRTTECRQPAHFRPSAPQHLRETTPPPTIRVLPTGSFGLWPQAIVERAASRRVWPAPIAATAASDIQNCLLTLLHTQPTNGFAASRRLQCSTPLDALPYWESRRYLQWGTLAKPLPLGVVAGLTVVLGITAMVMPSKAPQTNELAMPNNERTDDLAASRGLSRDYLLLGSVATPTLAAALTTTLPSVPPTPTTALLTPPTTVKPQVVVKVATVPSATSGCSASKAAAHACWDGLIGQYAWNTTTAFNVMWCESRGNPNARNARSSATGLFQILGGPVDPQANVRLAYQMYAKRGWQPWVCKG